MAYTIKNPNKNMHGNAKENIFIAYDDSGNVLGNAYTYPAINHYQTYKSPYMIYFDVMIGIENEDICKVTLHNDLFDCVLKRAKELRSEHPELAARFYTGFINDSKKLDCLKSKGFDDDCTIIMAKEDFDDDYKQAEDVRIQSLHLEQETDYESYAYLYSQLFVTPLTKETIDELETSDYFSCREVLLQGEQLGSYTIYVDEDTGYIETLFVYPEKIGKGFGKLVLECALNELMSQGVKTVELEVWKSNERAVHLYEHYGFKEIAVNIMFPSIPL